MNQQHFRCQRPEIGRATWTYFPFFREFGREMKMEEQREHEMARDWHLGALKVKVRVKLPVNFQRSWKLMNGMEHRIEGIIMSSGLRNICPQIYFVPQALAIQTSINHGRSVGNFSSGSRICEFLLWSVELGMEVYHKLDIKFSKGAAQVHAITALMIGDHLLSWPIDELKNHIDLNKKEAVASKY